MSDKNVHIKRLTTSGDEWGIPELEMFGFDDTRKAIPLPVHRHDHAYEFVYIESGKASWEVRGHAYETRTGEAFHSKPGEAHRGSYDVIEPCRFWWLIVRFPEAGAEESRCLGLGGEELRRLQEALDGLPRVTRPGAEPLRCLRRIRSALQTGGRFADIEIRLCLVDFLLQLCAAGTADTDAVPPDLKIGIDDVLKEGTERPEWNPSLPELAARANVSPSYYHRIFKSYTGLTPKKYFEHVKISEASKLLQQSNLPITDIAYRLGYSSTQHFAAAFRRFSGQTPTGWRSGHSEKIDSEVPKK
ncbi:AraC family transcriptional regulator [Cohnella zeiphila]|uniref:AraC family transcriptional regulator n=1 Tax=Cohnella zeiphila TaxID=2761120 RepID=A0A7X0VTM6_9BACL|nr:AraC family transcriptional regulator [Cohnella zeiphila]MBB6729520.1 AraC family transcriptional regulator [Cohnella zeiphila]